MTYLLVLVCLCQASISTAFSKSQFCSRHVQRDSGPKFAASTVLEGLPEDDSLNLVDSPRKEFSEYYRQDPDDLNGDVFLGSLTPQQKQELRDLFQQVHTFRRKREYNASDAMIFKIQHIFGVRIYNDPPVWTTQKTAPASYLRAKESRSQKRHKELFGSRGHPFLQVGAEINPILCPLSRQEINMILSKYTLEQKEGRYDDANAILFELKINGVECNVERNLWRADGNSTWVDCVIMQEDTSPYKEQSQSTGKPQKSPQTDLVRVRVQQLVDYRMDALLQDDSQLAQSLALELSKTYAVVVDDAKRTWSFQEQELSNGIDSVAVVEEDVDQNHGRIHPPLLFANPKEVTTRCSYRLSIHSRELPLSYTVNRIEDLINERAQKREQGKFREADAIRNELWMTYYVGLNDRLRQWSVGGVFDNPAVTA